MAKRYYQSRDDRMDESLGMRRGKESSKSQSYKSRRDESRGARKGHYTSKYSERPEGSYDRMRHDVGRTVTQNWECPADTYAMDQKGDGSMDYMEVKDRLGREDARRIKRSELSGDSDRY